MAKACQVAGAESRPLPLTHNNQRRTAPSYLPRIGKGAALRRIVLRTRHYEIFPNLASASDEVIVAVFYLIVEDLDARRSGPEAPSARHFYAQGLLMRYVSKPRREAVEILRGVHREIGAPEIPVEIEDLVARAYADDCPDFPMPLPDLV